MAKLISSTHGRCLAAAALLLVTGSVLAQAPAGAPAQDAPKNLKVLPKDWTRPQVIQVMQNFTAALGVGCEYCHVEKEGAPPDFASDDKKEKDRARAMMKIAQDLNARLPTDLGEPADQLTRIGCITCHRGMPEPKQIGEVLAKTSAEKGFAAASAQYSELKSKYYGAQAYDFSEAGLIATARPLIQQNRNDEAIQFLQLNVTMFPKSAASYVTMAQAQQAKKDNAGAIASLEKALAIDPKNAQAQRLLGQLKK
jgi:tetratricopeptide (TPR) repeat protein